MGSTVGPVVDQLKASGLMTPDQQKSAGGADGESRTGIDLRLRRAGSDRGGEPQRIFRPGSGHAGRIECEGSGGVAAIAAAEFAEETMSRSRDAEASTRMTMQPVIELADWECGFGTRDILRRPARFAVRPHHRVAGSERGGEIDADSDAARVLSLTSSGTASIFGHDIRQRTAARFAR